MAREPPEPISAAERKSRGRRVARIARRFGFVGRVQYRHRSAEAGGAQYGLAAVPEEDVLIVDADGFKRDADPTDYSLEALIAHERGHQLLARHPRLVRNLPQQWSAVAEEIASSLIGSLLVETEADRQDLLDKALFEAISQGLEPEKATIMLMELHQLLETIL